MYEHGPTGSRTGWARPPGRQARYDHFALLYDNFLS